MHHLQQENQLLWSELEHTYAVSLVTQHENDLQQKKEELQQIYSQNLDMKKGTDMRKEILTHHRGQKERGNDRVSSLVADL